MKRYAVKVVVSSVLLSAVALALFATDVLGPGETQAIKIVAARKLSMTAIGANVGDLRVKVGKGDIKGVAANATAIASLATYLPIVFEKTYSNVYPVPNSQFFFKGADATDFMNLASNLNREAETLAGLAGKEDKAGVEAQVGKLLGTCRACSSAPTTYTRYLFNLRISDINGMEKSHFLILCEIAGMGPTL